MDQNIIPLINGVLYSWASVVVTIGGAPITGITAIEYEDKQTVENIYGAGRYPIGRAKGRVEPTAKITLLQETVEDLQRQAPFGRIQDLGLFHIGVTYVSESGRIVHDTIRNCSFTTNKRSWKEGDTKSEVELDLVVSHIQWGAQLA